MEQNSKLKDVFPSCLLTSQLLYCAVRQVQVGHSVAGCLRSRTNENSTDKYFSRDIPEGRVMAGQSSLLWHVVHRNSYRGIPIHIGPGEKKCVSCALSTYHLPVDKC